MSTSPTEAPESSRLRLLSPFLKAFKPKPPTFDDYLLRVQIPGLLAEFTQLSQPADRSSQSSGPWATYFDIKGRFEAFDSKRQPGAEASAKVEVPEIHLADAMKLELALVDLMSAEQRRAKLWSLRSTFRELVSPRIYREYEAASNIAADRDKGAQPGEDERTKADLIDLIAGKYWAYGNQRERDRVLGDMHATLRVLGWFWLLIVVFFQIGVALFPILVALVQNLFAWLQILGAPSQLVVCLADTNALAVLQLLSLVGFSGFLGALVSVTRRLKLIADNPIMDGDPTVTNSLLRSGEVVMRLALTLGTVFSILLYFALLAGLAKVAPGFLPEFPNAVAKCGEAPHCGLLGFDPRHLLPETASGLAKLLVLSFLAGFAEKFVPDMLDSVAKGQERR